MKNIMSPLLYSITNSINIQLILLYYDTSYDNRIQCFLRGSAARFSFTRTLPHRCADFVAYRGPRQEWKGSSRTQYTHMSINIEKVLNFCFVSHIKISETGTQVVLLICMVCFPMLLLLIKISETGIQATYTIWDTCLRMQSLLIKT